MNKTLPVAVMLGFVIALSAHVPTASAHPGHHDDRDDHPHTGDLPENAVTITTRGDYRYIEANGIPEHETGRFPNRHNPNDIRPQTYRYRVPLHPQANDTPTSVAGQPMGVALNGVVFDPGTAENWTPQGLRRGGPPSAWVYDALSSKIDLGLDKNNAHVQPSGAYHYHGIPTGLVERLGGFDQVLLLGYAADGFPIYGPNGYADPMDPASELRPLRANYQLKPGTRPSGNRGPGGKYDGTFVQDWRYVKGSGDLDECNGRFGVTPEYPKGTYYYVLTEQFPFIPRMLRGTPDPSFARRGSDRRRPPGRHPNRDSIGPSP